MGATRSDLRDRIASYRAATAPIPVGAGRNIGDDAPAAAETEAEPTIGQDSAIRRPGCAGRSRANIPMAPRQN